MAMYGVLCRETERYLQLMEIQVLNEVQIMVLTAEQIAREAARWRR